MLALMPRRIISAYNWDRRLLIKVPIVQYPTTDYLKKYIKEEEERMKKKTKELVQELHQVPADWRKKAQSSSMLSPIPLERSRDHSSMSMRASTSKSKMKQRHSTFNAAVKTVQWETSHKYVPRRPYHQSSKSLVLPPRKIPHLIKGCDTPFAAIFP